MPLTWDVSKIENYKKNFPSVTRVDEPFPVHDKDGNVVEYLGERKEYEAWNPITNVLVMTNMLLGQRGRDVQATVHVRTGIRWCGSHVQG